MSESALRVEGLSKVFGGLRAVDAVTLNVAPGERRVLIGPNGAGKTTLFHCITGVLWPSAGEVMRERRAPGSGGRAPGRRPP